MLHTVDFNTAHITFGIAPLILGALLQGGGGILSGLLGSRQSAEAERRRRAYEAKIMKLLNPQYLRDLQNQFYNSAVAGPAFGAAQRGIFNAGQGMQNRLTGNIAARGLSTSGVGAIAPALAGSAMAGQLGQLRAGLYGQAGQMAGQQQARELGAVQALGQEPSYNYGAQGFAGGLSDLANWLGKYYGPQPAQK